MRKNIANTIIFGFVFLPLILFLLWVFRPVQKTNILIMDKTVLTNEGLEHRGFDWILSHHKYFKTSGKPYVPSTDYRGFFPLKHDSFLIKDLYRLSDRQIDSLSDAVDMTYYTDTYGIYYNEWYRKRDQTEHSEKVYGGLDKKDVLFLTKMKEKKKLIMAEFNFFATPTSGSDRVKAELLLGLRWSGWTGRYFESLDTLKNPELPRWVVRLYKEQHQNKWPFTRPGLVFVHTNETIAILESKTDLKKDVPVVNTFKYGMDKFGVPKKLDYPYWFDITLATDTTNRILSYYELFPNSTGDSILHHHNIPRIFPAAFENIKVSPFYYFCGDFVDSPIYNTTHRAYGIQYFKLFLLNPNDPSDRTLFFWRYYLPIVEKILHDYYSKK
ncbi:MAG: hypothetical protein WCP85_02360 [Mariniphaga sp.]